MATDHTTFAVILIFMKNAIRIVLDIVIGVCIIVTIIVVHFHCRRIIQSHPYRIFLTLIESGPRTITLRQVDIGRQLQPFIQFGMYIGLYRITGKISIRNDTFGIHIVAGHIKLSVFITFRNGNFIILGHACTQQYIHPVYTRIRTVQIACHSTAIHSFVINQSLGIFFRSHHFRNMVSIGESNRSVKHNLSLSRFTSFGGNQHHTVCTTRTINGSRRGVLQNLHALDVFRADAIQTALTHNTIYHIKRIVRLIDGAGTTYTNLQVTARHTTRGNGNTGNTSLQRIFDTGNRLVFELLVVHNGH